MTFTNSMTFSGLENVIVRLHYPSSESVALAIVSITFHWLSGALLDNSMTLLMGLTG